MTQTEHAAQPEDLVEERPAIDLSTVKWDDEPLSIELVADLSGPNEQGAA